MDFRPSEEQRHLIDLARRVGSTFAAPDGLGYPHDFARRLAGTGLTGIAIPERDGGQGGELIDSILVIEAVTEESPHAGDVVQATNFGAVRQIAALASEEIRSRYLLPVLAGDKVCSVAISESEAGSAVSSMRASARVEADHVVVNAAKLFNTHGPYANHYVVWARFGEGRDGIGAIVVDADTDGFSRGRTERYLSGEAHCALFFNDCHVPRDHVLSERDGLRRLLPIFNIERLGNAARSLACGQRAIDMAIAHVKERHQFGHPLATFQGLRWRLAEATVQLQAARLLLYRAATDLTDGYPNAGHAASAKYACNQAGFAAANLAVQCFGASGVSTEFPLAYLLARTREWMIAGGTIEVLLDRMAAVILDGPRSK